MCLQIPWKDKKSWRQAGNNFLSCCPENSRYLHQFNPKLSKCGPVILPCGAVCQRAEGSPRTEKIWRSGKEFCCIKYPKPQMILTRELMKEKSWEKEPQWTHSTHCLLDSFLDLLQNLCLPYFCFNQICSSIIEGTCLPSSSQVHQEKRDLVGRTCILLHQVSETSSLPGVEVWHVWIELSSQFCVFKWGTAQWVTHPGWNGTSFFSCKSLTITWLALFSDFLSPYLLLYLVVQRDHSGPSAWVSLSAVFGEWTLWSQAWIWTSYKQSTYIVCWAFSSVLVFRCSRWSKIVLEGWDIYINNL